MEDKAALKLQQSVHEVICHLRFDKLDAVLQSLADKSPEELKAIKDILPFMSQSLRRICQKDEMKMAFKIVLKVVHKDKEWAENLAGSHFFVELKSMLTNVTLNCDSEVVENLCLMINAATFQNPVAKSKISELSIESKIYEILKDRSHPIYNDRSNFKWKLPALKVLNNVQSWSQDFKYTEDYFSSIYFLAKSFEDEAKSTILVDDPLQTSSVLFNILKILIRSPCLKNLKFHRIFKLMDIGLHLTDDSQITAEALSCLISIRKRPDIFQTCKPEDVSIFIQILGHRCSKSSKLFTNFVIELGMIADTIKNHKERSSFLASSTLEIVLSVFVKSKIDPLSTKEILKLLTVLARFEYLEVLQENDALMFEGLEACSRYIDDSALLADLYHAFYQMSKVSMNYNEKVCALVIPHVIEKAKENWQDRLLVLRATELIHSIMTSVDHHELIQENMLMLLAKCLDVWRFDIALSEVILSILNSLPLEQWDVREEINKFNFIQLVKAIQISTESKLSSAISSLCTQFLSSLTESKGPMHATEIQAVIDKEELLMLSSNITQMLSQGEIMSLYTEDGRLKRFHVQVLKEQNFIVCKDVNALTAKEKYTMPIHDITKLVKGYEKTGNTPFERGTGFFSKYPLPENCFSLYSLTTEKGHKNFHFCCKDAASATRWVDAINQVIRFKKSKYKQALSQRETS